MYVINNQLFITFPPNPNYPSTCRRPHAYNIVHYIFENWE